MRLKPIKNKKKIMKSSSKLIAEKLKELDRQKRKNSLYNGFGLVKIFSKTFACVIIIVTIVVTYIYIEDQAQAEPEGQNSSRMKIIFEFYKTRAAHYKKQIIQDVLLENGVKSELCEEIAETIVDESSKTTIPIEMYLAIMKKESTFRSTVVSSARAKGIMQIQGGTWDACVGKHELPVSRRDIFQPQANIMVASVILKELHNYYSKQGYEEPEVWNYVLAAYYAGPASLKDGLKRYHWRYIEKIKQYHKEFEEKISACL